MGEYGSGLSIGQAAELDKELVRHALAGELVCGKKEGGFEYAPAPKGECDAFILGIIDEWYYLAKMLADSNRAMERIMEGNGLDVMSYYDEYAREMDRANLEFAGFLSEQDKAELASEIEELEAWE